MILKKVVSRWLVSLCILTLLALGYGQTLFASNYPLAYFTERISEQSVMMPEMDGDPAFWEPDVEDIIAMQEADLIILNGASYESWLTYASLPDNKVVDTSVAFSDGFINVAESTHSHGPEGEHSHSGTAFTTWIDLSQAVMQAAAIRDALSDYDSSREALFNENYQALEAELIALDEALLALTEGQGSVPLLGSHPVYQYFARRYQLDLEAVHWEPDSYPNAEQWAELESLQEEHAAAWMLWEDEPLAETVTRLDELGIRSVVFAPAGNRPAEGDFMQVMLDNLDNLDVVFTSP